MLSLNNSEILVEYFDYLKIYSTDGHSIEWYRLP